MLEESLATGETMMMAGVAPPHVEIRPPQGDNFTSLTGRPFYESHINPPPKFDRPTVVGVENFSEPTTTKAAEMPEIPEEMPPELRKVLLEMQSGAKKPEQNNEIQSKQNSPVQEVITEEQKSFLTKIWDSIKKFFPWNWSKLEVDSFAKNILPKT